MTGIDFAQETHTSIYTNSKLHDEQLQHNMRIKKWTQWKHNQPKFETPKRPQNLEINIRTVTLKWKIVIV